MQSLAVTRLDEVRILSLWGPATVPILYKVSGPSKDFALRCYNVIRLALLPRDKS